MISFALTSIAPDLERSGALLLLLSRDLNSSRRDLHFPVPEAATGGARQVPLPGFEPPSTRSMSSRGPRGRARDVPSPDDELLSTYLRRLAAHGAAPKGVSAYRYQL